MFCRKLAYSFLLLLLTCSLSAQKSERKDSLVRLLGCDVLQQVEDEWGTSYRKAIGNVRFEHNSTFLLCDTALWNVNAATIRALGNVKIIQNRTVLTSDNLDYFIDDNVAQFRGTLVQLQDKDRNTLRTRYLDYNTRDSVATFIRGGALRDKDGQIIESDQGRYDSRIKTFNFYINVNMYTDSVLVKTKSLEYNTETMVAVFGEDTYAWREDNMLSAQAGRYDRGKDVFTFFKKVHLMTNEQEAWADTLVYHRTAREAELFGNAELLDPGREIAAVGGYMQFIDSLQYIKMARDPAVIMVSEQKESKDTVYVGADELIYWTVPKCDIPEWEIAKSNERVKLLNIDSIKEYRKKAAEEARQAAEQAKKKALEDDPNAMGAVDRGRKGPILPAPWDEGPFMDPPDPEYSVQVPDTLALRQHPDSLKMRQLPDSLALPQLPDSLALKTAKDSTLAAADSLSLVPKDTTRIGFMIGKRNVRIFRKDMQVACDSLAYTDLDSLVRLYRSPIVWNEIKRQYSADSITVVIKDRNLDRASLMSNAFIIVQEDSICFDQIKGAEMMAYFDEKGALSRFDSMGGSSGLFFIEENGSMATVNKFEAKMLTASFINGDLYDLNYFEEVKSDAYPVVQLKKDERLLKGFAWQPEKRPVGPEDVTSYVPRPSERSKFEKISKPTFKRAEEYFPGYMTGVVEELDRQFELKKERREEQRRLEKEQKEMERLELEAEAAEKAEAAEGDEAAKEENKTEEENVAEGEKVTEEAALETPQDTTLTVNEGPDLKSLIPKDPKEEARARKKAEQEARKARKEEEAAQKAAKKEAKWAALDAKDAEKAARKAEKNLEKQRKKNLEILKANAKREAKEQKILEKYKERYEKKKAKQDAAKLKKKDKAVK